MSKAFTRCYGLPSYFNPSEQQFPPLRHFSGMSSSIEDSPPPSLPVKQASVALDDAKVLSSTPLPAQAFVATSTPTSRSPSSLEAADEATGGWLDMPQQMTVNMEYTTKLAGKLAAKSKQGTAPTKVSTFNPGV